MLTRSLRALRCTTSENRIWTIYLEAVAGTDHFQEMLEEEILDH